ncbi:hypothetical protein [Streptomyces sp. NPDC058108]
MRDSRAHTGAVRSRAVREMSVVSVVVTGAAVRNRLVAPARKR